MRISLILIASLIAGTAHAHVGHLGEVAGHDHWVAGAAIGIAIGIGLWGAIKDKARSEDAEAEGEGEEETEAA